MSRSWLLAGIVLGIVFSELHLRTSRRISSSDHNNKRRGVQPTSTRRPVQRGRGLRFTRVRGVPRAGEALGVGVSFWQRLDVLACPRCGRRLTLIEDPEVIVRLLGHLGLPTDIPEARARRCTSSVMRLRLRSLATRSSSTNPPDPACSPSARQTCASASGITLDRNPPNGHARPDVFGRGGDPPVTGRKLL